MDILISRQLTMDTRLVRLNKTISIKRDDYIGTYYIRFSYVTIIIQYFGAKSGNYIF